MMRGVGGTLAGWLLAGLIMGVAVAAEPIPAWLYPGFGDFAPPAEGWDNSRLLSIPGSSLHFTEAQIRSRASVIDWFPDSHAPVPEGLSESHDPQVYACVKCHMPNGGGRLENAPVAGLPARYILDQVNAIVEGRRHYPQGGAWPPTNMIPAARHLTGQQLAAAADYYASLPYPKRVDIVETDRVPPTEAYAQVLRETAGPTEPIGRRIVEIYPDFERFERRDPNLRTRALVPPGSVDAGQRLAESGNGDAAKICGSCHGPGLKGGADWPGPPLAGRFPTYLLRQLLAFQNDLRRGTDGPTPMRAVVEDLSLADMIGLAAYAASLDP